MRAIVEAIFFRFCLVSQWCGAGGWAVMYHAAVQRKEDHGMCEGCMHECDSVCASHLE